MAIEKIKEILVDELSINAADIKPESKVIDDLGADSLAVMQVVMGIEDEFGIEVPEEEIKNMLTVKDIVDYVEKNK